MTAELTPWFPVSATPGRVGWYDVKCRHNMYGRDGERLFWDADRWRWNDTENDECSFGRPCDSWRGLVAQAEKKSKQTEPLAEAGGTDEKSQGLGLGLPVGHKGPHAVSGDSQNDKGSEP